jgi:hypothetical protein
MADVALRALSPAFDRMYVAFGRPSIAPEKSNVGTNRSKGECIRPGTQLSLEDARRLVQGYVEHYNNFRLNSAVDYVTPKDMLAGRQQEIHAERDRKLAGARKQRQVRRQNAAPAERRLRTTRTPSESCCEVDNVRLPDHPGTGGVCGQGRVSRYRSDRITLSETRESLCRKCS